MRVLVVEDNDIKYRLLLDQLASGGIEEVERVKNFKSALPNVRRDDIDLLLLDMTFQVVDNFSQTSSLEALAGLQVMQYMHRIRSMIPTIVVTQHTSFTQPGFRQIRGVEQLDKLLKATFPLIYVGTVLMSDSDTWRSALSGLIKQRSNAKTKNTDRRGRQ